MNTTKQRQIDANLFRDHLRKLLIEHTGGCVLQDGADGKQWPCGTCVCALFAGLLNENAPQYQKHNDEVDRVNEIRRAVLQIRDAKL